jgi:hypothetical protein
MLRFGKSSTELIRAIARQQKNCEIAAFAYSTLSARMRKAVHQMQRKSRPNPTTIEAIMDSKAGNVTEVSIDDV